MPAAKRNLDYVVLLCVHMAETRKFYLETMKFPLEVDYQNWVSFRVGSGLLTLKPRGPGLAWDDGPAVPGSASVQPAFRVAPQEVDDWHEELVAKGVEILSPPKDLARWRHRTIFFRDPEGIFVEIYAEI